MLFNSISTPAFVYATGGMVLIFGMFLYVVLYSDAATIRAQFMTALIFISILSVTIGSVSVNCMVIGNCDVIAWAYTFLGLLTVSSMMWRISH